MGSVNFDVTRGWDHNLQVVRVHQPKKLSTFCLVLVLGGEWRISIRVFLFAMKAKWVCFLDATGPLRFMASSIKYVLLFIPPFWPLYPYSPNVSKNLNGNLWNMILVRNGIQYLENWKAYFVLSCVMSHFSMLVFVFFGIILSRIRMCCQYLVWSILMDECLFISVGYIIELLVLIMEMSLNSLHLIYCECGVDFTEIRLEESVCGTFFLRWLSYLDLSLYIDSFGLGKLKYGIVCQWWSFHSTLICFERLEPKKFSILLSCYPMVLGLQKFCKYLECEQKVWFWIVECFVWLKACGSVVWLTNLMAHPSPSTSSSRRGGWGQSQQSGKWGGNGPSSDWQLRRSGHKNDTQIIREADQAYHIGTPAQVKQLISTWEVELNQQVEVEVHIEAWHDLDPNPGHTRGRTTQYK